MMPRHFLLLLSMFVLWGWSGCKTKCDLSCMNEGVVTIDCECHCPEGFTGTNCETATCTLVCENGGDLTTDCTCDCPDGFTGTTCETCVPRTNLVKESAIWKSESGANQGTDNKINLPDKFLLTGLGFSTSARLMAKGRELLADGTLGDALEFREGPDPTGSLAVAYEVPDGHVITGVGWGESQDTYRLVVNYSEVLYTNDCDLYFGPEKLYDNGASSIVEVWLKISDTSFDTQIHAFGGIGIRYTGSIDRQVEAQVREVLNI